MLTVNAFRTLLIVAALGAVSTASMADTYKLKPGNVILPPVLGTLPGTITFVPSVNPPPTSTVVTSRGVSLAGLSGPVNVTWTPGQANCEVQVNGGAWRKAGETVTVNNKNIMRVRGKTAANQTTISCAGYFGNVGMWNYFLSAK